MYVEDGGSWTQRGHATRFRRYSLRVDGFASVQAPLRGGEFVTRPLRFDGKKLLINFSTSAAGSLRFEIQDVDGSPIPGFELSASNEIYGDEIEHVIAWERGSDLSRLASKLVRLRVALRDADLYSFRFAGATPAEA